MDQKRLLFAQFYLIAVIALMHLTGLSLFLYWVFWWYDIVVHFLGGVWVALAGYWASALILRVPRSWEIIALVVGIGICWEVFEVLAGVPREDNYAIDTIFDLCMDFGGALFGVFFARRFKTAQIS